MTTRINSNNSSGVPSGYAKPYAEFEIPSCGMEDVDKALFDLFDKELKFSVNVSKEETKKVPVIFAGGERWSMFKKGIPLRDKTGSLILPLITIIRNTFSQNVTDDITGRGINQQTGELVIKRRLDSSDRTLQNILNRLYLKYQESLAVSPEDDLATNQLTTSGSIGDLSNNPEVLEGNIMLPNRMKNAWEIITIPAPQFYSSKYEITFWSQHLQQMNQMIEILKSSYLQQGLQTLKITTTKGYWFIASLESGNYDFETNAADIGENERIIKTKMTFNVPAYILASKAPGIPLAAKKYISVPSIEFKNATAVETDPSGGVESNDSWIGSDDPTLPYTDSNSPRIDQRDIGSQLFKQNDPAKSNKYVYEKINGKLVRVIKRNNFTGETVYKSANFDNLDVFVVDDID